MGRPCATDRVVNVASYPVSSMTERILGRRPWSFFTFVVMMVGPDGCNWPNYRPKMECPYRNHIKEKRAKYDIEKGYRHIVGSLPFRRKHTRKHDQECEPPREERQLFSFYRLRRKNSCINSRHSASSTPPVTCVLG